MYKLSLVAPAYNEGAGISDLIDNWVKFLNSNRYISEYEICICDDKSEDDTLLIIIEKSLKNNNIKYISNYQNEGAACSLSNAAKLATLDWVFLIDSDDQYPIENLNRFLQALSPEIDAIIGYREAKRDSLYMQIGSKISSIVCNLIHGTNFKDFNCALKLIKRSKINEIKIDAAGLNYSADYLSKLIDKSASIVEIEVVHQERKTGKSSTRLYRDTCHRILFIIFLWFRRSLKSKKIVQ